LLYHLIREQQEEGLEEQGTCSRQEEEFQMVEQCNPEQVEDQGEVRNHLHLRLFDCHIHIAVVQHRTEVDRMIAVDLHLHMVGSRQLGFAVDTFEGFAVLE
jgi:hypothetical protein